MPALIHIRTAERFALIPSALRQYPLLPDHSIGLDIVWVSIGNVGNSHSATSDSQSDSAISSHNNNSSWLVYLVLACALIALCIVSSQLFIMLLL